MHTEIYCQRLDALDPVQAIRAIHQAFMQLSALELNVDCGHYDNHPALKELAACMRMAGHSGYWA